MDKRTIQGQINQYDKILQENIEAALPGLIKNVLKIHVVHAEELPDSLQHTKERKPDVLKKITDDKSETFALHIEFQTRDDKDMAYRMAEYKIMLARQFRIAVKQYVIYIGEGNSKMPDKLNLEDFSFKYHLISISAIDYKLFLRSKKPEEKMFAILADFGNENPVSVITKIATSILEDAEGELEKGRRKNQLRMLAQLRTLVSTNIKIMEQVSSFFKVENDIFYRVGEEKGIKIGEEKGIKIGEEKGIKIGEEKGIKKGEENKSYEVVKNLLIANEFSITQIVKYANVTEAFVMKVQKDLINRL